MKQPTSGPSSLKHYCHPGAALRNPVMLQRREATRHFRHQRYLLAACRKAGQGQISSHQGRASYPLPPMGCAHSCNVVRPIPSSHSLRISFHIAPSTHCWLPLVVAASVMRYGYAWTDVARWLTDEK